MNQKALIPAGLIGLALLLWLRRKPKATVTTDETYDTDQYVSGSTSYSTQVQNFARAIANAEGFGVPGAIPTIANNPGDLKLGEPTIPGTGITSFYTADLGWSKLYKQLEMIIRGNSSHYNLDTTIAEMGRTYAGGDENWAINVAAYLNVSPDARLVEVLV